MDLLERNQLAGLAIAPLEDGRIGTLAQLLELLEGAGVAAVVHGGYGGNGLALAEVADADR